jgi:hypothetical protein
MKTYKNVDGETCKAKDTLGDLSTNWEITLDWISIIAAFSKTLWDKI